MRGEHPMRNNYNCKIPGTISGFSLIELLVVLTIIALLGAVVGPQVMKHLGSAKADTTRLQVEDLGAALDLYYLDNGRYPETDEGLDALVESPAGADHWNGPVPEEEDPAPGRLGQSVFITPRRAKTVRTTSILTAPTMPRAARERTRMWSAGSDAGFTLVELLVVLAVLALALAVIPPSLSGAIDSARFKSTQRDLVSALRHARSRAVNSQQAAAVGINVKQTTIRLGDRQRELYIPDDAALTLVTAQREQLAEHEGAIRFYPDGSSTGGQVRFIRDGQVWSVNVDWLTGRVSTTGQ